MEVLAALAALVAAVAAVAALVAVLRGRGGAAAGEAGILARLDAAQRQAGDEAQRQRDEAQRQRDAAAGEAARLRQELSQQLAQVRADQQQALALLRQEVGAGAARGMDAAAARHEELRSALEARLNELRADHDRRLEGIRATVEEKLQGTLETRLGESFRTVAAQLEAVHKGLGEMQGLAGGVSALNRVLSNVKVRGTWGEVQLRNLLLQVLAPEQIAENTPIRPRSPERVEFAILLPGKDDGEGAVKLPIDAKFPLEDWSRLVEAAERADAPAVEAAAAALTERILGCAADIRTRYIHPPHSTDFAVLYLPVEGLYAEVLRRPGLAERLQREHRVVVAGPTTLAALLNSLQMGFRTLAIQKRTAEVARVLGAVKAEFEKHGAVVEKLRRKLEEAASTVDDLRQRGVQMQRKVSQVEALPGPDGEALLGLDRGPE
jgi:DNA recombination protein RmuC